MNSGRTLAIATAARATWQWVLHDPHGVRTRRPRGTDGSRLAQGAHAGVAGSGRPTRPSQRHPDKEPSFNPRRGIAPDAALVHGVVQEQPTELQSFQPLPGRPVTFHARLRPAAAGLLPGARSLRRRVPRLRGVGEGHLLQGVRCHDPHTAPAAPLTPRAAHRGPMEPSCTASEP